MLLEETQKDQVVSHTDGDGRTTIKLRDGTALERLSGPRFVRASAVYVAGLTVKHPAAEPEISFRIALKIRVAPVLRPAEFGKNWYAAELGEDWHDEDAEDEDKDEHFDCQDRLAAAQKHIEDLGSKRRAVEKDLRRAVTKIAKLECQAPCKHEDLKPSHRRVSVFGAKFNRLIDRCVCGFEEPNVADNFAPYINSGVAENVTAFKFQRGPQIVCDGEDD